MVWAGSSTSWPALAMAYPPPAIAPMAAPFIALPKISPAMVPAPAPMPTFLTVSLARVPLVSRLPGWRMPWPYLYRRSEGLFVCACVGRWPIRLH